MFVNSFRFVYYMESRLTRPAVWKTLPSMRPKLRFVGTKIISYKCSLRSKCLGAKKDRGTGFQYLACACNSLRPNCTETLATQATTSGSPLRQTEAEFFRLSRAVLVDRGRAYFVKTKVTNTAPLSLDLLEFATRKSHLLQIIFHGMIIFHAQKDIKDVDSRCSELIQKRDLSFHC